MTKTSTLVRASVLAVIASGFIAMTPPAYAADEDHAPQGELNLAGTDFSSPRAVNHLVNRLHRLAFDICAPDNFRNPVTSDSERKCYDTAIKDGLSQIESKRQEAMRATSVHMAEAQGEAKPTH